MKCSLRIERWSSDGEKLNVTHIDEITVKEIKKAFKEYEEMGVCAELSQRWQRGYTIKIKAPWIE